MTNYLGFHAIREELQRVTRAGPESVLYGVWNAILTWQFPMVDGYITRPQDRHSSQSGEKGFSDLHTYQYRDGKRRASKFLIVQCKRAGLESRPGVWKEGVAQLNRYLAATHRTRPQGSRTPVCGIVAIGKFLRVYEYVDDLREVRDWQSHADESMDLSQVEGPLSLLDHADIVQRILDEIRDDH